LDGLVDDSTEVSDSAASATLDHCLFSMVEGAACPLWMVVWDGFLESQTTNSPLVD